MMANYSLFAMKPLDLSTYGIPITINAPEGATVAKGMGAGEMDGVKTLSFDVNKDKFMLAITMDDAPIGPDESIANSVSFSKELKADDNIKIIKEEKNGYIFSKVEDGETNYGFYYVIEKNQRIIEFEEGLNFSNWTLAEIQVLFDAAKTAK